jgi:hypothetical protein
VTSAARPVRELPQIGRDLYARGPSSDHHQRQAVQADVGQDALARLQERLDRLDREHTRVRREAVVHGHPAAGVERDRVVPDMAAVAQLQLPGRRIHRDHLLLDEGPSPLLDHLPHVEADLIRPVDPRQHPGPHARVVVVRPGPDHGHPVTGRDEIRQVLHDHHVRVTRADEDEVL